MTRDRLTREWRTACRTKLGDWEVCARCGRAIAPESWTLVIVDQADVRRVWCSERDEDGEWGCAPPQQGRGLDAEREKDQRERLLRLRLLFAAVMAEAVEAKEAV